MQRAPGVWNIGLWELQKGVAESDQKELSEQSIAGIFVNMQTGIFKYLGVIQI